MRVSLAISSDAEEIPNAVAYLTKRISGKVLSVMNNLSSIERELGVLKRDDKQKIYEIVKMYNDIREDLIDVDAQVQDAGAIVEGLSRLEEVLEEAGEGERDAGEIDRSVSKKV
tara:strand:+ start:1491 stop:1832 length:342 start_codon:yes stop_codon:yes gene_type:complete